MLEINMNNPVYNVIGKTYDVTRRADPTIAEKLKKYLSPQKNGRYIDIGCGSGNYTSALFNHDILIEGIDISEMMLNKARAKYPNIIWHQGDASKLSFADASYNGATCILATHHFKNTLAAFKEVYRVMNNGFFVIFTATPEQMKSYWLSHYFPHLITSSSKAMLSFDEINSQLIETGFKNIIQEAFFVTNDLQDWFLQSGKYRPEIYLDKNVRDGISSFQLTTDLLEVENGIALLAEDIRSGKINKIIDQYESDKGDYLFVICRKE
jgi:ubiquinone/menaquinone biosynthesis C-methylase UbiE